MAQPQPRVLVITAVHSIYTLIQRTLKDQGFHTTHALSGDKVQTYLEDETHPLIILDLTHTKQQQIDDYHRLRRNTTIPLIVLIDGESGQHNGTITNIFIDNYLYYPFDPEDLITHVRKTLQPQQTPTTQRLNLHLGAIIINFDERQAMYDGQKVHLTRTEWKLLETLALHQGKTLTYRTLLQHVWGDAYHGEHSYVHTYISQLRRKLEPDPAKPCYLLTEVGVGYRLEVSTNGAHPPEPTATTASAPEKIVETPLKVTTPPTKLFGRETDTQAIQHLLDQPDVHLLTLTGPPGVGKTRLAQHIAETVQHQFTDGIYTISLAPLRDHSLVVSAIAQAIGAKESAHQTLHQALMQTLKDQKALLLLDNFEHVLEAASLTAELIAIAPDLTILVTSRTPLRIAGEQEYPVPPLITPDPTIPVSSEALAHNPAVALFVRRSQAVKPDFVLTDENAPAVAAICTRLDGLPLAIELAAARSKLFSPQALLARLDQRLALLSHNTTDAPERHQTLRAAIDWSYQLLQPEEQRILAGLSVFAGGCTLEAANSVLSNDQQLFPETSSSTTSLSPDPRTLTMINHFTTLVDHSLVQVKEDLNNESRFMLLETIREYAWEKLVEGDQMTLLQQKLFTYYVDMTEIAYKEMKGPNQATWLERIQSEYDNIRSVIQWTLSVQDHETSLRISGSFWQLWVIWGNISEGRKILNQVLAKNTNTTTYQYANTLNSAGILADIQSDYDAAIEFYQRSLAIMRYVGEPFNISRLLGNLGLTYFYQGDCSQAERSLEESLRLSKDLQDKHGSANALHNLGLLFKLQGKYVKASQAFQESRNIRQDIGDVLGVALSICNIGRLEMLKGNYEQAIDILRYGLKQQRVFSNKMGIIDALNSLGASFIYKEDISQAIVYIQESLELSREIGEQDGEATSLCNFGLIVMYQNEVNQAKQLMSESSLIRQKIKDKYGIAESLEGLGAITKFDNPYVSLCLCSAASLLRNAIGAPIPHVDKPRFEQTLSLTRSQLDEDIWQQAWDEGQKMSLEEAIDYALEHVVGNERAAAS